MAQEFVVRYLNFECTRIPSVVQVEVVRVDECYLLVYDDLFSVHNVGRPECLLGALAARMFCFKCKPRTVLRSEASTYSE